MLGETGSRIMSPGTCRQLVPAYAGLLCTIVVHLGRLPYVLSGYCSAQRALAAPSSPTERCRDDGYVSRSGWEPCPSYRKGISLRVPCMIDRKPQASGQVGFIASGARKAVLLLFSPPPCPTSVCNLALAWCMCRSGSTPWRSGQPTPNKTRPTTDSTPWTATTTTTTSPAVPCLLAVVA